MQNILTNWKTTLSGVVIIALSIASMFGIHIPGVEGNQAISIAAGIGLIFGKDATVTGVSN